MTYSVEQRNTVRDFNQCPAIIDSLQHLRFVHAPQFQFNTVANGMLCRFIHSSKNKNPSANYSLGWIPYGQRLITGNQNGDLTSWDGLVFKFDTITAHAHTDGRDDLTIWSIKWLSSGQYMLSADDRGNVKYWTPSVHNVKHVNACPDNQKIAELAISPGDGAWAAASSDGSVSIFDMAHPTKRSSSEGNPVNVLRGHRWEVLTVDWNPFNSLIVSGSMDGTAIVWDGRTAEPIRTISDSTSKPVEVVRWSPCGTRFLTAARDRSILLYDVRMDKPQQKFAVQQVGSEDNYVKSMRYHPTIPRLFVTGEQDGSLSWWHEDLQTPVTTLHGAHGRQITDMAFAPASHVLATVSVDQMTRFWGRLRPGDNVVDKFHRGQYPQAVGDNHTDLAKVQYEIEQEALGHSEKVRQQQMPWDGAMATDGHDRTAESRMANKSEHVGHQVIQQSQVSAQQMNELSTAVIDGGAIPGFG